VLMLVHPMETVSWHARTLDSAAVLPVNMKALAQQVLLHPSNTVPGTPCPHPSNLQTQGDQETQITDASRHSPETLGS
jgi:hypothetical protein